MAGQQRFSGWDVDSADFQRGLEVAVERMKVTTEAGLIRLGLRAVRAMKQFCPVDYGVLRSSIGMTQGKDARGLYVDLGTSVEYALPVEFGTSTQEAQPFVRPGLAEAVKQGFY